MDGSATRTSSLRASSLSHQREVTAGLLEGERFEPHTGDSQDEPEAGCVIPWDKLNRFGQACLYDIQCQGQDGLFLGRFYSTDHWGRERPFFVVQYDWDNPKLDQITRLPISALREDV